MKAIIQRQYGPADLLRLEDVPVPAPTDGEVLLRVRAASINSWDWDNLWGTPFVNRILAGLFTPSRQIPGADVAGVVESVGANVSRFEPRDEVFGDLCTSGWGAFAEYVCADADALAIKPSGVTFEQAAAVPQAGVMALQGIRDYGKVQPGQRVLINGAGGGVGTYAIQLAKMHGAEVTGVDSKSKFDVMTTCGADHVLNYQEQDYTVSGLKYDLILDVIGSHRISDTERAMAENGLYVMVGGPMTRIAHVVLTGKWRSRRTGKKWVLLMHQANKDLAFLGELLETRKLVSVTEPPYSLDQLPEALDRIGAGMVLGKAVVAI